MRFYPLHDRVLLKRVEAEEKSKGGIIIPESAKDKPIEGIVVSFGEGKLVNGVLQPLKVTRGDRVLFGKYSGTEIKVEGEEHVILREDEILGVFR